MQPNRPSSGSGGLGVPVEAGVTHAGSSTQTVPLAPASDIFIFTPSFVKLLYGMNIYIPVPVHGGQYLGNDLFHLTHTPVEYQKRSQ